MGPLISIIVPVWQASDFLPSCIDSILSQSERNFELILVDDGSTDGSANVCRRYAESDNRIIVLCQENRGVSSARNAGLKASRGQYIMFVDSDDTVEPDCIAVLLNLCI